ncbi:antibiotic biosynthesis monooxygenase family protein [Streptomyces sp. NPDC051954]|uniref:antibiotic biosynthesis monooxygenase family protein n=1 Tax=Streptomyces sp. NPDC051954 TaxID=3155524 RepID=UPI0034250241
MALITALPGKADELGKAISEGIGFIRQHPGCLEARVGRCVEDGSRYVVEVDWTSLEAHTEDFRESPLFAQWIGTIAGLLDRSLLETRHYAPQ